MAFRETSFLDEEFSDPFYSSSSRRYGETSIVPYGGGGEMTLARRSSRGALDRFGVGDDLGLDSSFRDRGFSSGGARDTSYQASSRDDVYYSSSSRGSGYGSGAGSSSMQVQLSSTSEEDSSSMRVRRSQVTVPPVETSRYNSFSSTETTGGGVRETYKPGRRSLLTLRRKPELTSRESYSFSASSAETGGGNTGYGGGTYTSVTTDIDDRYRVRSSGSYSRY
jgi:hypothetical protein